jgi:hypothetical protein
MKYQNNITNKFAKFLNTNINITKIAFNTNYNSINHINNRTKNFTKNPSSFNNSGIYILKCNCNSFYIGKTNRNFKIRYEECISEIKLKDCL